jgi:hypothetical protein
MTRRFSRTPAPVGFVILTIPAKRFTAISSSAQGIPAR